LIVGGDYSHGASARRYTRADYLVLAALFGLFLVAFWEVFFGGRVFFFRDFALFFYPRRWFVAEALRQGTIPFWNPYSACGEPVLGAYQSAVFYPPALLYYLLPMPASFMWFVAFHYLVSGVGVYHMMRVLGARRPAATLAAFAWTFSPPFIGALDQVSFQTSLAWLPWGVAFAKRLSSGLFLRGYAGLSISFALAVLAGAPEPVIFIAAVTVAFVLWQFFPGRHMRLGGRCAAVALALGALVTGVLVSGVEVVPFLHALRSSARQATLPVSEAGKWSAAPGDALLLFLPRFNLFADRGGIYWRGQQFWLKTAYLGAFIPLMALWTAVVVRRRRNWFFVAAALLFVLMAAGSYSPLWKFGYAHVPGISQIRYPVKFLLPAAFACAVLAGFALDDAIVLARRKKLLKVAALVAVIVIPALLFLLLWHFAKSSPATMLPRLTPPDWMGFGEPWKRHFQECYESTIWSLGRSAAFLAAGAVALIVALGLAARRIPRPYGVILLVAVLFADVAFYSAHLNPLIGPESYTENPGRLALAPQGPYESRLLMTGPLRRKLLNIRIAEMDRLVELRTFLSLAKGSTFTDADLLAYLRRTNARGQLRGVGQLQAWLAETASSEFRTQLEYEFYKETFYPNANILFRVPAVDGFEPMAVKWHNELMARLIDGKFSAERLPMLTRLWGASMLIDAAEGAPGFAYAPVSPAGKRALLASHVLPAEDDVRALSLVADGPADVTRAIVLAAADAGKAVEHLGPDALAPAPDNSDVGSATLISDDGNASAYAVDARQNALLFVADTFFPNFAATVDGNPAPLWRANYAYRAVPVPTGKHVVRFSWRPYDLHLGAAATLVGLLVLIATALVCRRRRNESAPAASQG
jgi:hypothetical protein